MSNVIKQCPTCERGDLVIRTNTKNDSQFLGCTEYPVCKHTEAVPETVAMRAMGAPELPFDEVDAPRICNHVAFVDWEDGEITAPHALRSLLTSQEVIDQQLASLNAERDALRNAIGHIVATMDRQRADVAGYRVELTAPSTSVSYDRKTIERVLATMTAEGDPHAIELAQARRESQRAGSLRITKDKVKA